ncbi:hypothetical protein BEP19_07365 [Ammoniphilus oxalaticus]|uniref:Flagellar protein FliL n=1 Tax=Ammoniphilus oxalaticus TaxID=66863 RepID=A0A419SJR4_9BACL|nr:flagellar basal body-associated FliL family protein [Ammoniphilus oxalaticus]RKD24215.1 hypothetical protein BEP19_07365 [Ammoniphilus oxalaticus]
MNLFRRSILIMVAIAAIAVISLSAWNYLKNTGSRNEVKAQTAENWVERTVETEPITTNLLEGGWIKVQFAIETDSPKIKQTLENTSFQTQSIILKIVAQLKREQLGGQAGLQLVEEAVRDKLNETLGGQRVLRVYTTDRLIQ